MQNIIVQFDFTGVTSKQYDQVWNDLRAAGQEHPKGLLFHAGAPKANNGWLVVDLWESEEAFNEFGKTLMPLISKNGFPDTRPTILPAHNVYYGHMEHA